MLHSLRFRLLITTVLVVLVTVIVMAALARQRTASEFQSYVEHGNRLQQRRVAFALTQFYSQARSWGKIQPFLEDWGQFSGDRIIVADSQGKIVGDSAKEMTGKSVGPHWPRPSGRVIFEGADVGTFYVNPAFQSPLAPSAFITAINRTVLLSALIALAVAIVIILLVSHRIVQPIESLTSAARRMEKGDLTTRVSVGSSDEIGQLARAFNAMADGLARQEQLRRNMVTDVAHELRAPLTNIRGFLEAAKDGLVPSDETLVSNLYEEAMLLNRLVQDLQDLALADAGQLHIETQPVKLADIVQATTEVLGARAEARTISIQVDVAPDLPLVCVDAHRLGQVLRNLLNNALDFTPPGGQVTISAWPDGPWMNVQVRDTGPGIPAEHLSLIFERFYRTDPSRTRATGGAGLGLAIVKQLVQAHGGQVWAESAVGQGTAISFTLPLITD